MKRIFASLLLLAFAALFTAGFFASAPARAEEAAAVKTIPTTEIKTDEGAGAGTISAEEVEKARAITAERIYWLIGLWLLIALAAVLIRWQLRHDDKLYQEGYYSREL
jgi:hypothetical protein